ncbi:hypothetical protein IFO69_14345 [Echinicola sp. CAU 1574]|uniref:Uncharacterized protein n=1 Tax=Echinicola arenosa TaxID=2774144 RepID=A0ABR9APY7_9BACT|nr:hypothetical protein [Echinicola arenosa]MBD8489933.1 hypothetical protein [Echinicola arenosa]
MEKEKRASILSEISDWLKLLGLVVLVGEAIIILAMNLTPKDHPMSSWYPVFMLIFLVIIVIGVFIDRYHQRNSDTTKEEIKFGSKVIDIDTHKPPTAPAPENTELNFVDNKLGFSLKRPQLKNWKDPLYLSNKEYLLKLGAIQEEQWPTIEANSSLMPFGNMLIQSETVMFEYGEPLEINFTDASTTDMIEKYIIRLSEFQKANDGNPLTEEEQQKLRYDLFYGQLQVQNMMFSNSFIIQVMDKKKSLDTLFEPNLPNLYNSIQKTLGEGLDQLVSGKDSILWSSTNSIKNIAISGETQHISIYRMNRLFENEKHFYQLQIQWSPQSKAAISIWEELKEMFETFKLIE